MADTKKLRAIAKAAFTRAVKSLNAALDNEEIANTVQNRYNNLKSARDEARNRNNNYLATLNDEELELDTWIDDLCEIYDDMEIKADKHLKSLKVSEMAAEEEARQLDIEERLRFLRAMREKEKRKFDNAATELLNSLADFPTSQHRNDTQVNVLKSKLLKQKELLSSCEAANKELMSTIKSQDDEKREISWELELHTSLTKWENEVNNRLLEAAENIPILNSTPNTPRAHSSVRMEKIKFESFQGDIRKYPRFKEEFLKHIKTLHRPEDEAFVLRSYLNDSVKAEIENLDEDAVAIWDRLDQRYGSQRKLVDTILNDIKQLRAGRQDSPERVLKMIATVEKAFFDLKRMGHEHQINNAIMISKIEEIMPTEMKREWVKIVVDENDTDIGSNEFGNLLNYLLKCKRRIEYEESDLRRTTLSSSVHFATNTSNSILADDENQKRPWCWMHPGQTDHPIWKCKAFIDLSPAERLKVVRENQACFVCLLQKHSARNCPRDFKCKVENCGGRHHYLLHGETTNARTFLSNEIGNTVHLQIQAIEAGNGVGSSGKLNVLWDSGSTVSFITFAKARELHLKGEAVKLEVEKIGASKEFLESKKYSLTLVNLNEKKVQIEVLGIEKVSSMLGSIKLKDVNKVFPNLNTREFSGPESNEVHCLIGLDYASLHPQTIDSKDNLVVVKNVFGTTIGGSYNPHGNSSNDNNRIHCQSNFINASRLEDFYAIEQLGIECQPKCGNCKCGTCHLGGKNMSIEEEKEAELIEHNLLYDADQKVWIAGYPWIKDPQILHDNRFAVQKLLEATERRLLKNKANAVIYKEQIDDMLNRKVCRIVSENELNSYNGAKYYMAHHAVLKPDSKSTPVRIVFNTSALFRGISLNDCYAKGPDMLNNLMGILLRFRENKIGIAADIRKMYHSIQIPLADQMTHLFLWRNLDLNLKPQVYAMTCLNFGDKPSGAIACIALRKTAEMFAEISSRATEMLKNNTYVDDILDSVHSDADATEVIDGATKILLNGGFHVKEWILSFQDLDIGETVHVLGMEWNVKQDELVCRGPDISERSDTIITKRVVMSQIASIYDPLGLVGPIVVKAKIFLRKLWILKVNWDDELSNSLKQEWHTIRNSLLSVNKLRVPRCLNITGTHSLPALVLFFDGSEEAYGTTAYIRWQVDDDKFHSDLIASKNRVAPLKKANIVRLELSGALLSKRLRCFIQKESRYTFQKIYHIGDSEIVTAMVRKESYGFNTFAANRIGEIQRETCTNEWYWIPGDRNIADWVTRGKLSSDLTLSNAWKNGPDFLCLPESEWPIQQVPSVTALPETKKATVNFIKETFAPVETLALRIDINRFSRLQFLYGVTARMLKLYKVFSSRNDATTDTLNKILPSDMKEAEQFWIHDAQKKFDLENMTPSLVKLNPKGVNGIIVAGGRVKRWNNMTLNNCEFILLPKDHRLSYLVVHNAHEEVGHLRKEATVAFVRTRFWIIGISNIAKGVCSSCVICKRKNKQTTTQIMGTLPIERLQPSPAFDSTGVDYFGPFAIKGEVQQRVRGKCFGVVFTCFASRAVYTDISQDYSLDSFMQTIRRFGSRHGWPRKIFSDRGSQLVAASKEIKDVIESFNEDDIQQLCRKFATEWHFSPPDAPWMNGTTESMVKAVKKAIQITIGDQVLKFSELLTVFYECSELVNRRPIGKLPSEIQDGTYLSPNDLLLGRSTNKAPQGPFDESAKLQKRFQFIQTLVDQFWKRWTSGYFPTLVLQKKWHHLSRNMQIDDVVIMKDKNALRDQWKIGKIIHVLPNDDGVVRRVVVRYATKTLLKNGLYQTIDVERAVHNLIVLVPAKDTEDAE